MWQCGNIYTIKMLKLHYNWINASVDGCSLIWIRIYIISGLFWNDIIKIKYCHFSVNSLAVSAMAMGWQRLELSDNQCVMRSRCIVFDIREHLYTPISISIYYRLIPFKTSVQTKYTGKERGVRVVDMNGEEGGI